jgi:hypothetical protein
MREARGQSTLTLVSVMAILFIIGAREQRNLVVGYAMFTNLQIYFLGVQEKIQWLAILSEIFIFCDREVLKNKLSDLRKYRQIDITAFPNFTCLYEGGLFGAVI